MEITREYLREYFHYNRGEGTISWKKTKSLKKIVGRAAGGKDANGYMRTQLNRKPLYMHHVVWCMENNEWPPSTKYQIDHINGNRSDNRISNLRLVSQRDNLLNTFVHRGGRLPGCSFNIGNKKWLSQILIKGKRVHIGYFKTEKEAHEKYMAAKAGL